MPVRRVIDWSKRRPGLVIAAGIGCAVMILLAPWLARPDTAIVSPTDLGTDMVTKQWPNAAYIVRAWREEGRLPLWRAAAMGGVPIPGNPSMLLAYPPYWLIFILPIGWAFTAYFALHLVWAGWGVYAFARRVVGLSPGASLLAALSFALSAKVIAHLGGGHADVLAAVAWLPWLWWAADSLARRPTWPAMAGAALAAAAQAVTHLPTLLLSAWIVGAWVLAVRVRDRGAGAWGRSRRAILAGLGAVILAGGLAAAQLWPMAELLPLSTRGGMTVAEAGQYALPATLLVGLVFPMALAFPEWVACAGLIALALVPASWSARRSARGWWFLAMLAVVGIVFALGQATPLYPLLFRLLPGLSWARVPTRILFATQMALGVLAGTGWDALRRSGRTPRSLATWWGLLALLMAIGAVWTHWLPGLLAVPAGSAGAAVAAVGLLLLGRRLAPRRDWMPAALAGIAVIEAVSLTPQLIARARPADLAPATPEIGIVRARPGEYRIYSPHALISLAQAVMYDLESVDGIDPFQLGHYARWANAAAGCDVTGYAPALPTCTGSEIDPQAYLRSRPSAALLALGNARYVVADHALAGWPAPAWQSGSTMVYENQAALPRAFVVPAATVQADDGAALAQLEAEGARAAAIVPAPAGSLEPGAAPYHPARLVDYGPDRLEIAADGPGWLVVGQVWAPGWRAKLDGATMPVYRTDVAFCGLPLPTGPHRVTLEYAPAGWRWGRWISLATAAAAVAVTVVLARRRRGGSESG